MIKGIGAGGSHRSDIIVKASEAANFHRAKDSENVLKKCKVIIIL